MSALNLNLWFVDTVESRASSQKTKERAQEVRKIIKFLDMEERTNPYFRFYYVEERAKVIEFANMHLERCQLDGAHFDYYKNVRQDLMAKPYGHFCGDEMHTLDASMTLKEQCMISRQPISELIDYDIALQHRIYGFSLEQMGITSNGANENIMGPRDLSSTPPHPFRPSSPSIPITRSPTPDFSGDYFLPGTQSL